MLRDWRDKATDKGPPRNALIVAGVALFWACLAASTVSFVIGVLN